MRPGLPEWWGARHPERMGNTPTSTSASPPGHHGRLLRRRRPAPSARLAGQTAGLRRPARLPAGPAGRRLERPPVGRPPRRHPGGHPPRPRRPPPPPAARRERLARQRQRNAEQRAATRVADLGFESVQAYLVDRLVMQAWSLTQVVDDLGAAPTTVRRLLDQHGVRRVGPTRRQRAVVGRGLGPLAQAHVAQQRRQARLRELGFAGIEGYLRDRYVGRAGRYGDCAPNSRWVMVGWISSFASSGCEPDHPGRMAACGLAGRCRSLLGCSARMRRSHEVPEYLAPTGCRAGGCCSCVACRAHDGAVVVAGLEAVTCVAAKT